MRASKLKRQSGVQYAGQRREGATRRRTPNESRWTVMWTAPVVRPRSASVFHVAANGANGDERADGDYVYTLTREVAALKSSYSLPSRARTPQAA